jgi:hypothetical protein
MGCFSLSFRKKIVISLLLSSQLLYGAEIEGVKIPDKVMCEGQELPLHGAGLRTATFLKIKVFVLAFYSPVRIQKPDWKNLNQRPMCFHLTYLRDFDSKDVDKAWDYQFKESSEHNYPELKEHIMDVKKYFGEIKGDRAQHFSLVGDTTRIYENGKLQGEIQSADFQKSFLSIWLGKNPPTKVLQEGILGDAK